MYETTKRKLAPCSYLLNKTTDLIELTKLYETKNMGVITKPNIERTTWRVQNLVKTIGKANIKEVSVEDFDRYKEIKLKKGVKNISINSYFVSFIHFWSFLGLELKLQLLTLEKDRIARLQKQILTNEEFVRLLETIDNLQFKAAVSLLWELGIRVGENSYRANCPRQGLLGLDWIDIDFEKCIVEVHLKGGSTQRIPLGVLSEKYLRQLKESGNRGKIAEDDPVFVSQRLKRMSYPLLHDKLRDYMKFAGIPAPKRHPHAFRHSCGTRITEEHGVYTAKLLLCHSRLATTEVYVHLSDSSLMAKIRPDKVDKKEVHSVKMKQCPKCGANFTPDVKLCFCGYDFTANRCHNCGAALEKDSHFCYSCGLRLGPQRPQCICGHALRKEYKVCPCCGRDTLQILKLWDEKNLERWQNSVT